MRSETQEPSQNSRTSVGRLAFSSAAMCSVQLHWYILRKLFKLCCINYFMLLTTELFISHVVNILILLPFSI